MDLTNFLMIFAPFIFAIILLFIAISLIVIYGNWQIALGVFLLVWANNIGPT